MTTTLPDASPAAGLTRSQVATRLSEDGHNELPAVAVAGALTIVRRQLVDPVILVLAAAAVLTALTGEFVNTAVIVAVIALNTALGTWQQLRSTRAIAALSDLTAARATVRRDGVTATIDARDVVRGDHVLLAAGDIVAADGHVAQASGLELDESVMTGEAVPVARTVGDVVAGSTVVTRGRGTVVVDAVGGSSRLGGISRSLDAIRPHPTPMQRQLSRLARRLALGAAVVSVVVGAVSWAQGTSLVTSVVLAVSLAVAAIPESLPAVVSVAMARAGGRIARRGVLARSLASVEALGSVSVIASDKTGTLTTGQMTVDEVWNTEPAGHAELLTAGALCNDAEPDPEQADGGSHDDPLEIALIRAATTAGIDVTVARHDNPRTGEQAFDARLARMSTEHRGSDGPFTICKGSPEAISALLGDNPANAVSAPVAARMTSNGHRVIAVARRNGHGPWSLLGLIAFTDPARADAARTIGAFRAAGVTPIMITGDHAATAAAIAATVGIAAAHVHARIPPDGKLAIIEELRRGGDVVAMTGDGVNDAPALRAADIGVAMGRRGTEVAKQAAGMILRTDQLSAMVPAIVEGRRAYDNVRRFLVYALAGGTAEVLVMVAGPFVGFVVPLQAAQILWINLLTHGLPGVAMGDDPAAASLATAPPRPRDQQILDQPLLLRIAALGTTAAVASLVTALLARGAGMPWQSTLFLTLLMAQLAIALGLQPRHPGVPANRWLLAAVGLNVALGVAAVTWSVLGDLLQLEAMSVVELTVALPAVVVSGVLARCVRVTPATAAVVTA